uniref:Carbohydrate kinase family protein n=1 Tax=Ignisphaera aggregans TaxID=334771 RepID=A0A7C2ZBR1_9CREN
MTSRLMFVGPSVCDIVAILPRLSEPSDIVFLDKGITISIGGHPINIAVDLVKLGYDPRRIFVVTAIGNDFCGVFIEKNLTDYGLQPMFYKLRDRGSTKNLILVFEGEDRRFHLDIGSSPYLPLDYVVKTMETVEPGLLHISPGILGEVDSNMTMILRRAQERGAITFVDVGASRPLGKNDWDFLVNALEYTDIFHCNSYEIKKIFGVDNIVEGIRKIVDKGVKIVTVTDGDKGAYVAKDGFILYQKSFKVKAVDPTGAGDAFQAGLIYSLATELGHMDRDALENIDINTLSRAVLYAQATGAVCVTQPGATTAVSKENVEKLLSEQSSEVLSSTTYIVA